MTDFSCATRPSKPRVRDDRTIGLGLRLGVLVAVCAMLAATAAALAAPQEDVSTDSGAVDAVRAEESDLEDSDPEPSDGARPNEPATFDEEILVTARRRAEDPQKIPISLTAFSEETLEQRSLRDLSDLSEQTANLDVTITGGFSQQTSEATVFIRGVGQIDTAIFSDPGVGIYLDGVYLARAQGAVLDLLDLERVEILRGPQGTLFGKNTTGGAIQLITRRPARETSGRIGATVGRFDRVDARLLLDTAVTDSLFASAAVLSARRDGYSRSLASPGVEYFDDDRLATRFGLEWAPSERFDAYLTAEYTREDETGGNQLLLDTVDVPLLDFYNRVLVGEGLLPYSTSTFGAPDVYTSFGTAEQFLEADIWGTTADLSWTSSSLGARSITAFRQVEYDTAGEGDGSPRQLANAFSLQEQEQLSQEIHVFGTSGEGPQWLAGAIVLRETPEEVSTQFVLGDLFGLLEGASGPIYAPPGAPAVLCDPGPPPPGVPCFGGAGNPLNFAFFSGDGIRQELDLETTSYAVFSESTWSLGADTSLTAGARVTRDEKTFDYLARDGFGQVTSDLRADDAWTDWSGRLSLSHQAREELLLYGTVSRGFKSGGFNGRPQSRPALDPFDPETVVAYELGAKSDWLERRLRVNGAAFFSDYEDIHFAASLDVDGVPVFVTQNAGDAEIYGFEIETEYQPSYSWLFELDVGHLESELTSLDPRVPPGTVSIGNELPKTPDWTYALSAQYLWLAESGASVIASADYAYRGDVFNNFENTPQLAQDGYGLLGARVLFTPASTRWDVAVFGTNLTDEEYLESGFFAGAFGAVIGIGGRPREWGVSATYRFGGS